MPRIEEVINEVQRQEVHVCEVCGSLFDVYRIRVKFSLAEHIRHSDPPFLDYALCKMHMDKYAEGWKSEGYQIEILGRSSWGGVPL
jgi:hypothetical protein